MTKRVLHEAGTIAVDQATNKFRVRLISEGKGSSATYNREFFTEANAQTLAGALSFPGHPFDLDHPETRDPMTAIGYIGDIVTIEEDENGKLALWSEYNVAKSKPEVGAYLAEFGPKLGLSIYAEGDGRDGENGEYFAESLSTEDPYRSVDLVIAAGRGGKFDRRAAESLRKITEASALAEGKEVKLMEISELGTKLDGLSTLVESLVTTLTTKATAEAQAEADSAAVTTIVESRLVDYDKAVLLISEAKLTESQSEELRARALKGEDIAASVESAKKVLSEARTLAEADTSADHLGGGAKPGVTYDVAGFGKVS